MAVTRIMHSLNEYLLHAYHVSGIVLEEPERKRRLNVFRESGVTHRDYREHKVNWEDRLVKALKFMLGYSNSILKWKWALKCLNKEVMSEKYFWNIILIAGFLLNWKRETRR